MRDLLFKNLTSSDHHRRIIASSEVSDKSGIRTTVRRHFVYLVREVPNNKIERHLPYLFVLKERNTHTKSEKFYCRMKGNIYAVSHGKLLHIQFMHSLRIYLNSLPADQVQI
ncbi:MAG: hypothetical protein M0R35_06015 [Candidatus Omnitrophica bacterium]|nr:hypothetical protein [Candidatus Omnitrophota bacterium]